MSFGRYRLLSQLSAGRDGVRYRALDRHDGSPVEMILLADARGDAVALAGDRTHGSGWRLMIAHPSSRRVDRSGP